MDILASILVVFGFLALNLGVRVALMYGIAWCIAALMPIPILPALLISAGAHLSVTYFSQSFLADSLFAFIIAVVGFPFVSFIAALVAWGLVALTEVGLWPAALLATATTIVVMQNAVWTFLTWGLEDSDLGDLRIKEWSEDPW